VISQNAGDPVLVDIVTTVDDVNGRECSLKVEFSTDNGATWARAHLTDASSADYGTVRIDNEAEYQLSQITTNSAGANTIRFQWDTQISSDALLEPGYNQVLIRTTQWNGETLRPPVVSTRGFVREFPAVVVDKTPLTISLD
jgi:flagellar hook assembly protein FlgD